MSAPQPSIVAVATLCLAAFGTALHAQAAVRLQRHFRRTDEAEPASVPPLTLWRALKPGVPDLARKLDALVEASRPGDQILLGADTGSAELATCDAFRATHPDRDIVVIACKPNCAPNPKISKFLQMAPHARHPHWLLTDSESLLDAQFVEGFRREWMASGADVQTAGYRFAGLKTIPQILDACPALLTLWPGLMLTSRMDFTLGACTGVKFADMELIGGWNALAQELAEDQRLGALLAEHRRNIRLSRHVLTLDSDPLGWGDYLRHQHRVAVTYRVTALAGALGLPIFHTVPFAALAAVFYPPWWWTWTLLILVVRIAAASVVSRAVKFRIPLLPVAVIVSALVETVMWIAAWFSPCVWWAARWRRVRWRGRLT